MSKALFNFIFPKTVDSVIASFTKATNDLTEVIDQNETRATKLSAELGAVDLEVKRARRIQAKIAAFLD